MRSLLALLLASSLGCGDDATADTDPGEDLGAPDADAPDADADADADAGAPVNPLLGIGEVEAVQGDFLFIEGPLWRPDDGVLLFSDLNGDTIYALTPPSTIAPFRNPSAFANGLASLPDGRLLAAEHGARRVSVTDAEGTVTDFAATDAMGRTFNSPNDIAVRSDGTVYFTDPPYGLAGRTREIPFNGVYRVAPDGTVSEVWQSTELVQRPNGVALSPDESVLYVADTEDALIRRFDVAADGSTSGEATFVTGTRGADGLAVDRVGNVYVAISAGVQVIAPDGTRWGMIDVPERPANCAFGGDALRTLYITAQPTLYRVSVTIPGDGG